MGKHIRVKLGPRDLVIVDDSGEHDINIYIPGIFQLMQIDSREGDIDYIGSIIDDITQRRLKVFAYRLAGKVVYDFEVGEGSEWNDYPRPQTLVKGIMRLFGRGKVVGYLETDRSASKARKINRSAKLADLDRLRLE